MAEILGRFTIVGTTLPPLSAHLAHLNHLTNAKVAKDVLKDKHKFSASDAKATAGLLGAFVRQALEFHHESRNASLTIRPVLQYYAYLNLAVAVILAYRPANYSQYRQHGVEDCTHALNSLELGSVVVKVKRGAVPLFHSILSDVSLESQRLRLGQILSGAHMVSNELSVYHGKTLEIISVHNHALEEENKWHSQFTFTCFRNGKKQKLAKQRLESFLPILKTEFKLHENKNDSLVYRARTSWTTEQRAKSHQQKHGLKLINIGGHELTNHLDGRKKLGYFWRGIRQTKYLPTLSSTLLTAFAFASIARYRPNIVDCLMNSPIQLVHSAFVQESDSIFIPAIRNLLYKEETIVSGAEAI